MEKVRTFPSEFVSGGIQQRQVSGLSGLEIKSWQFLKVKGHSAFRNVSSIQELGCVCRYRNFFSSNDETDVSVLLDRFSLNVVRSKVTFL
jgi:hypothetical protein